jgi:chromosomal replication initiator protein
MSHEAVWSGVIDFVGQKVSGQNMETWLKPVSIESLDEQELVLSVPNRFSGEWIREHYLDLIREGIKKVTGLTPQARVFCREENGLATATQFDVPQREKRKSNLNSRYVFDTFVVGAGNQFAHAASRKVAEKPGNAYNPLFIYGGVGLGKTHLLNAVGNHLLMERPETKIVYISSEQFTNEVINSIRYDKMLDFRNRYRTVDCLLIDDIQFIAGKERTQEEFFHTFNTLYEANKQIVISSDRSTKEMSEIEERLRSRFEMGLIADIQPPDLETKIVILRKKSETEGIPLPNDVALFLASHVRTNIRELEGSLIRLGAFCSLTGQEISLDLAKRVLRDTIQEKKQTITVEEIQKAVADRFQVKLSDLKSKRRTKNLVYPRQVSMYLCREMTNLSFPEIGRCFGGKDHSTVIHACKQIEKAKEEDFNVKTILESLIQHLKEA